MTEELYDSGIFEFTYPIWTLHDLEKAQPGVVYFRKLITPDKGDVFPVFTDMDLATRFLEITRLLDCAPLPIRNAAEAVKVGKYWFQREVRHVGLDLSALVPTEGGVFRIGGSFADLAEFIKELCG